MLNIVQPSRLTELAASIIEHHHAAQEHARRTLEHAIACGDDLVEARSMVPEGKWQAWCSENVGMHKATVGMYVRLATFREELRAAGVTSVQEARDYVRDHDLILSASNHGRALSDEVVAQIWILRAQGLGSRRIARQVGAGASTVKRIIRGESHKAKPAGSSAARRRIEIDDAMIEGMARWLCSNFVSRWPDGVTDQVRAQAVEALRAALSG